MARSINQDIHAGGSVYHIQTEYYRSSGKIVTNIFKDGLSVKRLEKDVSDLPEEEIDREVENFHNLVLEKLKAGKKREEAETKRVAAPPEEAEFFIPRELYERLLVEISPFFGIASSFVLDEAIENSRSFSGFLEELTSDLPQEQKKLLTAKIKPLIENYLAVMKKEEESSEESQPEAEESFTLTPELRDKILTVLSDYFGIMASVILDEAVEDWEISGGSYEELVDIISSHADSEEEANEIKTRLMFL